MISQKVVLWLGSLPLDRKKTRFGRRVDSYLICLGFLYCSAVGGEYCTVLLVKNCVLNVKSYTTSFGVYEGIAVYESEDRILGKRLAFQTSILSITSQMRHLLLFREFYRFLYRRYSHSLLQINRELQCIFRHLCKPYRRLTV